MSGVRTTALPQSKRSSVRRHRSGSGVRMLRSDDTDAPCGLPRPSGGRIGFQAAAPCSLLNDCHPRPVNAYARPPRHSPRQWLLLRPRRARSADLPVAAPPRVVPAQHHDPARHRQALVPGADPARPVARTHRAPTARGLAPGGPAGPPATGSAACVAALRLHPGVFRLRPTRPPAPAAPRAVRSRVQFSWRRTQAREG